ncbi:MAG: response regulator [Chitinispirillaceae bacterium]|nr:response regulator [Chitinispirillaceae bacterium]
MGILSLFLPPSRDIDGDDPSASQPEGPDSFDNAVDLSDLMGTGATVQDNTAPPSSTAAVEEATFDRIDPPPAPVPPSQGMNPSGERTLEDMEAILLQALMDNLSDVVYFKDLKSRFILVNAALAAKHLSTSDGSRAVGRTDFDFFAQEHAKKAYEDEQRIISTGIPLIGIEEREVWPDGHETWVRTSKYPLKNAKGKTIGTWGISRDITDRKRAEQELQSSEEQLRHAQKMEAFVQLAGGIAHDFNNMLSVILGAAQLVEMDVRDGDADLKRNINMVIDTSKRAAELTQQLLSFARKEKYTIVPIDAHEVIQSVVSLIGHTFDKHIRVAERLKARSTIIMGDFAQLQNALLNLALNARDAMPGGGTLIFESATVGPSVDVDDTQDGEIVPGSFLRLRVSDTGCGMDDKTKTRAFEPFFTTKEKGKGTGLGLASVYGTIKKFSGMIECTSALNKGTRFTIFLPLVLPKTTAEARPPDAAGQKSKVLVVDDEKDLRLILSEMLESLGYETFTCKDGVEAAEYYTLHSADIDAVIVDLVMPRMGGYECIKRIKAINPAACILVSSGYNLVSDTQQIIAKGIAGFIQKPYQAGEISKILFESLGRR